MDLTDQRHCLDVARTLLQEGTSPHVLIQAALLHDVGKIRGDLTMVQRICLSLCPRTWMEKLAQGQGKLANAAHVQLIHPQRGAHMAQCFGAEQRVVSLISGHHRRELTHKDEFLARLQAADELN